MSNIPISTYDRGLTLIPKEGLRLSSYAALLLRGGRKRNFFCGMRASIFRKEAQAIVRAEVWLERPSVPCAWGCELKGKLALIGEKRP